MVPEVKTLRDDMEARLDELDEEITTRIRNVMPKNARSSGLTTQGHLHPPGAGSTGGLIHYDMVVDGNWTGLSGLTIQLDGGSSVEMYSTLQAAITAADADNAVRSILINGGTYTETVTIAATFDSTLILIGEARDKVIIDGAFSYLPTGRQLFIEHLTFNSTWTGNTTAGQSNIVHAFDCRFIGAFDGNIASTTTDMVQLTHCTFEAAVGGTGSWVNPFFEHCDFGAVLESTSGILGGSFSTCNFRNIAVSGSAQIDELYLSDCRFYLTGVTSFHANTTGTIREIVFNDCRFPPLAVGITAAVYVQACALSSSGSEGIVVSDCTFDYSSSQSAVRFIRCDTANAVGWSIGGNRFMHRLSNYLEDDTGISVQGVFVDSVIGPNSPPDFALQADAGTTGTIYCGTGTVSGAAANSVTVTLPQRGAGAPSHTAPEGTAYWDTTNNNLYVNSDGATTWQSIGGATVSNLVVEEDNVVVATGAATIDFTDSDATVTSVTGTAPSQEVDVALNLYALLAGRAVPQNLSGGVASADDLTLRGTSASGSAAYSPTIALTNDIPAADAAYASAITLTTNIPAANAAYAPTITLTVNIPSADAAYSPAVTINEGGVFGSGDTTLTVNDATDVAVSDILLIESEKLLVTAKAAPNLTVVRGVGGTSAAAHADLTAVTQSGTSFAYTSNGDDVEVNDILLIESEKLLVTAEDTSNNILTVTRGVAGSSAAAHAAAVAVQQSGTSFVYTSAGTDADVNDVLLVDAELMLVTREDAANILTVTRGVGGSTATVHAAAVAVQQSGNAFVYTSAGDAAVADDAILIDSEELRIAIVDTTQPSVGGILTVFRGLSPATHAATTAITKMVETGSIVNATDSDLEVVTPGRFLQGPNLANGTLRLRGTANATIATARVEIVNSDLRMATAGYAIQDSNGTDRIALTAVGNVEVVGPLRVTASTATALQVIATGVAPFTASMSGTSIVGGTFNFFNVSGTVSLPVATTIIGMNASPTLGLLAGATYTIIENFRAAAAISANSSTTITDFMSYDAVGPSTAATVTRAYNFRARDWGATGTNLQTWYQFFSASMTKGVNRHPFYDSGTAAGDAHGNRFRSNTQFGSTTGQFGAGDGVIGIAVASTLPTAGGVSGGVIMWSESVASVNRLRIRNSDGTTFTT